MKTYLVIFSVATIVAINIFGCKKTSTNYTTGIAGMHQWSGIAVLLVASGGIDTFPTAFQMNITAVGNSSIAFTDPVLGNYETLNLVATDSANTRLFTYNYRATGFNSLWIIDSIQYNDISKTIVWHEYSGAPLYDLFLVSQ